MICWFMLLPFNKSNKLKNRKINTILNRKPMEGNKNRGNVLPLTCSSQKQAAAFFI